MISKEEHQIAQATEWCKNARLWIQRSKKFGPDMKSSSDKCINDAEICVVYALGYLSGELVGVDGSEMLEYKKRNMGAA